MIKLDCHFFITQIAAKIYDQNMVEVSHFGLQTVYPDSVLLFYIWKQRHIDYINLELELTLFDRVNFVPPTNYGR